MCKKCGKNKCCCATKVISRLGLKGAEGKRGKSVTGPPGPPGPTGQLEQVVGQSATWASLTGAIGTTGVGTTFTNLQSNFFVTLPKFFSIDVGFFVTAGDIHTIKCYFLKNDVQVGPTYERNLQAKDYVTFKTQLLQFQQSDTLKLYVETTAVGGVTILPGHLINFRLL